MESRSWEWDAASPPQVVTNDDMARIVDTSDEWITSRTGIRSRHHCRGETHTQLCREAAQRALSGPESVRRRSAPALWPL